MARILRSPLFVSVASPALALALALGAPAQDSDKFTIEQVLAPAYPYELVTAQKTDRIAWLANERGRRNVYTAAPPDFTPVRLTSFRGDNGIDLTGLRISDDGSTVVFVRGHAPNRDGWIANPTSDPAGGERAIWAATTTGLGEPWKVIVATNPVLSPDGKWVLFTGGGQIHGVPVDANLGDQTERGKKPLFLAHGSNSGPVFSPDGKKIAFTSNRGDHSFVGVYDVEDPGVSYLAPSVDHDTSPTWSGDGQQIAFIRRPGTPFGAQSNAGQRGGGRGRRGGGFRGGRGRGGQDRPIDGLHRAAFSGGYTMSMWVADVETGEGREFWHNTPNDRTHTAIRNIQWAGDNVVFQLEPDNWQHYFSLPLDGGRGVPVDLTPGEGFAEQVGLTGDGEYLYYASNVGDIDRRHLWRTSTSGGQPVRLTSGLTIETYPAPLASGDRIAILNAGARQPLSVALVPAAGGRAQVIFPDLSEFPSNEQVAPQNVLLTADDGFEFHNQVFVPRDIRPGEKRPAVLFTHGGPRRQMLLGYHYRHFYHMAYAINQYLANQGYVVISVNYRSGIGYGAEFRNAPNRGGQGNAEYKDVIAAGRYLQSRADVDPERIGLWGLSYGGVLTAQGLARNSDVFAAGVDIAGVHLWGSSVEPDDVSYQSSAIAEVGNWTSPVLLIHGDDDRNVAFAQTTGLVQLLRANDVYHELIVFPDDVHSFLLFNRWVTSFQALDEWFTRFLKNGDPR